MSFRIYIKSLWIYVTMLLSNILTDKTIEYALNNYSELDLYVINTSNDLEILLKKVNSNLINSNINNITITTDKPKQLKEILITTNENR